MRHNCHCCLGFADLAWTAQVYKQQQAAVATEGSKETRFFEGAPASTGCSQLLLCPHMTLPSACDSSASRPRCELVAKAVLMCIGAKAGLWLHREACKGVVAALQACRA